MKFLIAGLGSIGRRHLRNLVALGERDILLYRTHQSTLPDEELAGFVVETDLQMALAQKPDAVIVANPTALHLEVALPAVEAGCHLFLEKPISHSLQGVAQLSEAVMRRGIKVLVGFQFRFHPALQQARRLIKDGAIGEVFSVRAHWGEYLPNWHPWEDYRRSYAARPDLGGGVTLTLCHPLDYVRWLLGEVECLWAFTGRDGGLSLAVEDRVEIGLRFAGGAIGSIHLDYLQRPAAQWLEVIGSQGTLRWDYHQDTLTIIREVGIESQGSFLESRNDMFMAEMEHFLAVLCGEAQPACTLEDGVRALELALAAHESEQQGRVICW